MTIKNYTTQIKTEKTVMEIEQILVKFGAQGIYKEYQSSRLSGIMFFLVKNNEKIPFKIPLSLEKTRTIVTYAVRDGKLARKYLEEPLRSEQGERIGWRVIKDWIHSQLSLLEINFADALEILLPYAYNVVENKTMYQKFLESKDSLLALENKEARK